MKNIAIVILLLTAIVFGYIAFKPTISKILTENSTISNTETTQNSAPTAQTPSASVTNTLPATYTYIPYVNNPFNFKITFPQSSTTLTFEEYQGSAWMNLAGFSTAFPYLRSISINQQPCGSGDTVIINNISFAKIVERNANGGMESGSYDADYCVTHNGMAYNISFSRQFNRVDPSIQRPDETTSQKAFDEEMKALHFEFTTVTTTAPLVPQAILNSISPESVKIGSALTLNGKGFMSVPPLALQGTDWKTGPRILVYMLKKNDPFAVPIFLRFNPASDTTLTVTVPNQTCTHTSPSGVCDDQSTVTPGVYTVWVQVYGQDKTDSLEVIITN